MQVSLSVDFEKALARLSGINRTLQNRSRFVDATQNMMIRETALGFRKQVDPDNKPWNPLKYRQGQALRDTGQLLNSIVSRQFARKTNDEVAIGTNLIYAPLHNYGGTIRPVKAKMLAIPLRREARRLGSPRKLKDGFIQRSQKGNLIIFRKSGAEIIPMFVLKDQVVIPARKFLGWGSRNVPPILAIWGEIWGESSNA